MATEAQWLQYYFLYVSFDLNEPDHVHITTGKSARSFKAKVWLERLEWAGKADFSEKELNKLKKFIEAHKVEFKDLLAKARNAEKIKRYKF